MSHPEPKDGADPHPVHPSFQMPDAPHSFHLGAAADTSPASPVAEPSDLDTEMMLLALEARDLGEATVEFDIAALSPNEKRALIRLMRQRLGLSPHQEGYTNSSGGDTA